jgi:hypothetical protein
MLLFFGDWQLNPAKCKVAIPQPEIIHLQKQQNGKNILW